MPLSTNVAAISEYGDLTIWDSQGVVQSYWGLSAGNAACLRTDGSLVSDTTAVYSLPSGNRLAVLEHGACAFAKTPGLLYTQQGKDIVLWDNLSFRERHQFDPLPWGIAVSPEDSRLAIGHGDRVEIVDAQTLTSIASIAPLSVNPVGAGQTIAWSPDGSLLAYSLGEALMRLYDANGSLVRTLYGLGGASASAWSSDGVLLAVGDVQGAVRLWNSTNWSAEAVESYHTSDGAPVASLAFGHTGDLYVGTGAGTVERWQRTSHTLFVDAGPARSAPSGDPFRLAPSDIRGLVAEDACGWNITGPSAATLAGTTADFTPSMAGTYQARIDCTDAYGHQASSAFVLRVFPRGDSAPSITINSPASQASVGSTVVANGNAADDVLVERVEVGVDWGAPIIANGTDVWSITLTGLNPGTHAIRATAYDAYRGSARQDRVVNVAGPALGNGGTPWLATSGLINGSEVSGEFVMVGVAGGPDLVASVSVDIATSDTIASGTESWYYVWDTRLVADGWLDVVVTAVDVNGDEARQTIRVFVNNTGAPTAPDPSIRILLPANGSVITGSAFEVRGTATPGDGLLGIQVRIDGAMWRTIAPGESWQVSLDSTRLLAGIHRVSARALDHSGLAEDAIDIELRVTSNNSTPGGLVADPRPAGIGPAGGALILLMIGGASTATVYLLRRRMAEGTGRSRKAIAFAIVALLASVALTVAIAPSAPAPWGSPGQAAPPPPLSPPSYLVAPAYDFTCLAPDGTLLSNDVYLGQPIVVYVTRADNAAERQTLALVQEHREDAPPDTVFIAIDVDARTPPNATEAFLFSEGASGWRACEDTFSGWDGYRIAPGALFMVKRDGALDWQPSKLNDESWVANLASL